MLYLLHVEERVEQWVNESSSKLKEVRQVSLEGGIDEVVVVGCSFKVLF